MFRHPIYVQSYLAKSRNDARKQEHQYYIVVYLGDGLCRNRLTIAFRRRMYSVSRNILSRYADTSLSSGSQTNVNLK